MGLVTSILLPLITITKTVWVNPTPISKFIEVVPITNDKTISPVSEAPIDWSLILSATYGLIAIIILLKAGIEIASFFYKISRLNKQKEANYTLINAISTENPFSFFKYIVINPTLFSEEEFKHILTHERIHAKQWHSIDVLFSKVLCALFWINPISWLYRKAILQNLEFIADNQSLEEIDSKYEYQKTLLKVIVHQQTVGITNPFYQSLIKKRIIMLHKNQSDKRNAWKYAIILPALVGFMLLFQIETNAQVKEGKIEESNFVSSSSISSILTKNSTDEDLSNLQKIFSFKKYKLKISKVKRNKKGEINAIKLSFDSGKTYNRVLETESTDPIKDIKIFVNSDKDDDTTCGFEEINNDVANISLNKNDDENQPKDNYWSLDNMKKNGKEVVLIINGKIKGAKEKVKISLDEELGEMVEITPEKFEKKYNQKADKNQNYYEVETVKSKDEKDISINPESIIYLNDKEISKDEMDKINPNTIKSVDVSKSKSIREIRIVTMNKDANIDAEILLDNNVVSKEDLNKIDKNEIESINIKKDNRKKIIEIRRKNAIKIDDKSLEKRKEELAKAKIELEKTKAEIEKTKAEIEKLKSDNKK